MAINYAAKYSEKIDERFALMSVTAVSYTHLGRVPVVKLTSREISPFDMFPASEFLSIAMTNRSIYNKCRCV